ncbi:MAG TPA: bifunctional shikimate kinase/3-dehydroquinate synthase [Solirubrobacteraceae bacterium]|jgi:shikimate kinase/3-dehydroquinate synthase|nr:bifunctional shikimate kinase/3-dehydroquinate synthase [Solirubrobacteraceae bacterium]
MAGVERAPRRALVLIGFMGAGKSTVAVELARALGVQALDSDALLQARLGHSPAREFELHGEASFREAEERLVCELLDTALPGAVIALGGGSILSERVRVALEPHVVVLLDVAAECAWARVGAPPEASGGALGRPLARDREAFFALHAERRELYERHADAIVPSLARGEASRVLDALRALAAAPAGARLLWAQSSSGDYPVLAGRGLLRAAGADDAGELWPIDRSRSRAFCVTDEVVASLYGDELGWLSGTIAVAPGERHKTLASAERVWGELVGAGVDRGDHLVALGGGVVGDLAGFCAATYQRGVPIVHVPTTLLAQVDSAYGGKTGVDLPQAKNYVGAYHQPAGVLVDSDTLESLPAGELSAGWVEVLKTALIAGGPLWERVGAGADLDDWTILACARTKLAVVAADERDGGRRQVLNLGHTVGHAIETATGYTRYRHGEAVGLGLLAALRLSGAEELRARVGALLEARDLPTALDGASVEQVVAATARDKKRVGEQLPFVLLERPGEPRTGCEVAPAELRAAVAELAERG